MGSSGESVHVRRTEPRRPNASRLQKAFDIARKHHEDHGHFGHEHGKLSLRDSFFWPGMDTDTRRVIIECPQCKSFGSPHLNALLQPVRRRQPFDLIAGDYVSLPKGKGGYKTLGVYIDTYSNFVWVQKLKSAGTGKSTVDGLTTISEGYAPARIFMADGGSHFVNKEVEAYCEKKGIKHITTPSYAPYVNGLCEGANKILLQQLQRLCAPDIDSDESAVELGKTPYNWPDHLEDAVRAMNDRVMPALLASPRELLFGMQLNHSFKAPHNNNDITETTTEDAVTNFRLSEILRDNVHLRSLIEADRRAAAFNDWVHPVTFALGDLVQIYKSKMDQSYETINKIAPKWSGPHIITGKYLNSYSLCTLTGTELQGKYHARRLKRFIPRQGSDLDLLRTPDDGIPNPEPDEEEILIQETEGRMATILEEEDDD